MKLRIFLSRRSVHGFSNLSSVLSVLFLFAISCNTDVKKSNSTNYIRMMDDTLLDYNRQIVGTESQEIDDYILRHRWKMITTPTGLRYMMISGGKSDRIRKGDRVTFRYTISLLNGLKVYSSDSLGSRTMVPGKTEGESGLQEALLLLGNNDHAKLIIPSHLAFGLLGDRKGIPSQSALVYDIEILSVVPKNR